MLHIVINVDYTCTLMVHKLTAYSLTSDILVFWRIFSLNLSSL